MNQQFDTGQALLLDENEFRELVELANDGDREALGKLRDLLDACPAIYETIGNLAEHAERLLVDSIAGPNQLLRESLLRKLRDMRAELASPSANLLERMAVERVVACWLQLQHADTIAARPEGSALPAIQYRLKWQEKANKRYLDSVRSLMDLRRLLPNVKAPSHAGPGLRVFATGPEQGSAAAAQGTR